MSNKAIRQQLRQRRRELSTRQQISASEKMATRLSRLTQFQYSRRIAFYLGNDGEIDPAPLLSLAQAAGKACYLPVLHPLKFNRLHFARYQSEEQLEPNRFGIPEPSLKRAKIAPAWALDLILLPLVAFDKKGHRMGMGGGFYDRTLAFAQKNKQHCPQLIGLAHSFQQVENIEANHWDIPMNAIITEQGVIALQYQDSKITNKK